MKIFLIILVFLIFCAVSFFIGYNLGINEQIERELFESFGAEIQKEIEDIIQEKRDKEKENSDSKI